MMILPALSLDYYKPTEKVGTLYGLSIYHSHQLHLHHNHVGIVHQGAHTLRFPFRLI